MTRYMKHAAVLFLLVCLGGVIVAAATVNEPSKNIALVPTPSSANLEAWLGIALTLTNRGHTLTIATSNEHLAVFASEPSLSSVQHFVVDPLSSESSAVSRNSIERRRLVEASYPLALRALLPLFNAHNASSSSSSSRIDIVLADVDSLAVLDLCDAFHIPLLFFSPWPLDTTPLAADLDLIAPAFDHPPLPLLDHFAPFAWTASLPPSMTSFAYRWASPFRRFWSKMQHWWLFDRELPLVAPRDAVWPSLRQQTWSQVMMSSSSSSSSSSSVEPLLPLPIAMRDHVLLFGGAVGVDGTDAARPLPPHLEPVGVTSRLAALIQLSSSESSVNQNLSSFLALPSSLQNWLQSAADHEQSVLLVDFAYEAGLLKQLSELTLASSSSSSSTASYRGLWFLSSTEFEAVDWSEAGLELVSFAVDDDTSSSSLKWWSTRSMDEDVVSAQSSSSSSSSQAAVKLLISVYSSGLPPTRLINAVLARLSTQPHSATRHLALKSSSSSSSSSYMRVALVSNCQPTSVFDSLLLGVPLICISDADASSPSIFVQRLTRLSRVAVSLSFSSTYFPTEAAAQTSFASLKTSTAALFDSSSSSDLMSRLAATQSYLRLAPGPAGVADRLAHVHAFGVEHIVPVDWTRARALDVWQAAQIELFSNDMSFLWLLLAMVFTYRLLNCCCCRCLR